MSVVHPAPVRRCCDDSGAILAEAAFITPIFFLLIFGILDYGLLFRDYLTLGNGTTAGARMAAVAGNDSLADWNIIQAVKKGTAAVPPGTVTKLVVFYAAGGASSIPPSCQSAAAPFTDTTNRCNGYAPSRDWVSTQPLDYNCTTPGYSLGWCPTTRKVTKTGVGPDFLGVYLEFRHQYLTKLFGSSAVISDTTLTRLEPQK